MKTHSSFTVAAGIMAAASIFLSAESHALSVVFNVNNGNWNVGGNWVDNAVPGTLDDAFIRGGRIATIDSPVPNVSNVYLGATSAAGTVVITTNGALTVSGNFEVMRRGTFTDGAGTVNMTGGALTVGGLLSVGAGQAATTNGTGTFNLSDGVVTAAINIGAPLVNDGTGAFNITGRSATIGDGGSARTFAVNSFGTLAFTLDAVGVTQLAYQASAVSFGTGSTLNVNGSLYTGAGGDIVLINGGTLSGTATNIGLTGFAGYSPALVFNEGGNGDVILRLTAIPEPSGAELAIAAVGILLARRKRRA